MFVERHDRGEWLCAVGAADLLAAVGVHSLVSAEVGKLRVRLAAHVTAKRLNTAVDMLVLLQTAGRGEVLPTLRAAVRTIRRQFPLRGG